MKIAICGDLLLRTPAQHILGKSLKEKLQQCDIRCVNFEVPIEVNNGKGIHKSGPVHSQSDDSPRWVIENGFNLITFANNHTMDYGQEGLKKTLEAFESVDITGVGTYDSAYDICVIEKEGLKIGFLGLTHKEFGCVDVMSGQTWGTAAITSPRAFLSIANAKKSVDRLYILAHAGVEKTSVPLPEWKELYRTFIDLGADGVIASHPHVPQGYEIYRGCPIIYSMGNFLFESGKLSQKAINEFISLMVIINQSDNSFEVLPLIYDYRNHTVDIDESSETKQYIESLNSLLKEDKYKIDFCNELKRLQPTYHSLMVAGGAYSISLKEKLKNIIRPLIGRKPWKPDSVHLLNLFQCESHRWMMMHYLKNRDNNS